MPGWTAQSVGIDTGANAAAFTGGLNAGANVGEAFARGQFQKAKQQYELQQDQQAREAAHAYMEEHAVFPKLPDGTPDPHAMEWLSKGPIDEVWRTAREAVETKTKQMAEEAKQDAKVQRAAKKLEKIHGIIDQGQERGRWDAKAADELRASAEMAIEAESPGLLSSAMARLGRDRTAAKKEADDQAAKQSKAGNLALIRPDLTPEQALAHVELGTADNMIAESVTQRAKEDAAKQKEADEAKKAKAAEQKKQEATQEKALKLKIDRAKGRVSRAAASYKAMADGKLAPPTAAEIKRSQQERDPPGLGNKLDESEFGALKAKVQAWRDYQDEVADLEGLQGGGAGSEAPPPKDELDTEFDKLIDSMMGGGPER